MLLTNVIVYYTGAAALSHSLCAEMGRVSDWVKVDVWIGLDYVKVGCNLTGLTKKSRDAGTVQHDGPASWRRTNWTLSTDYE